VPLLLIIVQEKQRSESLVQSKNRDALEEHSWNYRFINPLPIPCMSEISGAVHLAQLGLTTGKQAGKWNPGEILKFILHQIMKLFALLNQYNIIRAILMYSRWFFHFFSG